MDTILFKETTNSSIMLLIQSNFVYPISLHGCLGIADVSRLYLNMSTVALAIMTQSLISIFKYFLYSRTSMARTPL